MPAKRKSPEEKAETKAKDGKMPNMVERYLLGKRLAAARMKPKPTPWAQLAKKEGYVERTLQNIHRNYLAAVATLEDPKDVTDEALHYYTLAIEEMAMLVDTAQDSVKIAALRSLLIATRERLELLSALGRLPRRPRSIGSGDVGDQVLHVVVQVLESHKKQVGPEVMEELASKVRALKAGPASDPSRN